MQFCLKDSLILNQSLLDQTEAFLQEFVAPKAALLDADPQALQQALQELGSRQLLALRVPQVWQGQEVNDLTFRVFQELIARYSGALAFLQTQHQSAASLLAQSQNQALKQEYLPYMASGEKRIGLGFSQVRRQGEPAVKAVAVKGGYQITGEVPWITGFGVFDQFILGAVLPESQALFGLVPLKQSVQPNGGSVTFSPPLLLAAMASTNTVTASLKDWFLANEQVLDLKPADSIHETDRRNVLHHGFFALGCAQAGLDIVAAAQRPDYPFIADAAKVLRQELAECRSAIYQAEIGDTAVKLNLRAWAIDLAVRCAHAAVTVSRGAANYATHPAQRVYREALAFTVFGQTTAVMEATLMRLSNRQQCSN